jgi:hypothetical protein
MTFAEYIEGCRQYHEGFKAGQGAARKELAELKAELEFLRRWEIPLRGDAA